MRQAFRALGGCAALALGTGLAQGATFASFDLGVSGSPFTFTNSGATSTFVAQPLSGATTIPVTFRYKIPNSYSAEIDAPIRGTLTLSSTVAAAGSKFGTTLFQPMSAISLTFTADDPVLVHGDLKQNLLTVTNTTGLLRGTQGTSDINLSADSGAGHSVTFTSDFLDLDATTARNLSLSFTSAFPALALSGGYLASFTSAGNGSFGAVPEPTPAPEPATLALLAVGAGTMLTRRKR